MSKPVLGIDLGTTNSVVACVIDGKMKIMTDEIGQQLVPSVVSLGDGETIWFGAKALAVGASSPGRMAYAVKRLVGRRRSDPVVQRSRELYPYRICDSEINEGVVIQLGEQFYPPEEISSLVLMKLKEMAADQFGFSPQEAIITVPAYFGHSQRSATQRAAEKAGLRVLRLLNEPTAAALSLAGDAKSERVAAVYDLGGGTFDISIIRIQSKVYEVLSTDGDTFLGGDDIDGYICDHLAKQYREQNEVELRSFPVAWHRLRDAAQNAKKELSQSQSCSIFLPRLVAGAPLVAEITRSELESMARPLIERSLDTCLKALTASGLQSSDLNELVLIGGSTRMPLLRSMVEDFFGLAAMGGINPDTAVAQGAAREGALLSQGEGALLLDVTPMALGISILGNRMYPLIERNTKIPTRTQHVFTTHREGQNKAKIKILQGDSQLASDNLTLGEIVFSDLHSLERFGNKLEVVFEVDTNGIMHVKAVNQESGREEELTIDRALGQKEPPTQPTLPIEPDSSLVTEHAARLDPTLVGPFHHGELLDVLYFLHTNHKTGRIDITDSEHSGWLQFNQGQITSAQLQTHTGEQAVKRLLAIQEGRYAFYEGTITPDEPQLQIEFDQLIRFESD